MKRVGSWTLCINPFSNPVVHHFFRGTKTRNDIANICSICWYEAQKKNGTLQQTPRPNNTNSWRHHSQLKAADDLL